MDSASGYGVLTVDADNGDMCLGKIMLPLRRARAVNGSDGFGGEWALDSEGNKLPAPSRSSSAEKMERVNCWECFLLCPNRSPIRRATATFPLPGEISFNTG